MKKKGHKVTFLRSEKDTQLIFLVGHFVSKVIVYFFVDEDTWKGKQTTCAIIEQKIFIKTVAKKYCFTVFREEGAHMHISI